MADWPLLFSWGTASDGARKKNTDCLLTMDPRRVFAKSALNDEKESKTKAMHGVGFHVL